MMTLKNLIPKPLEYSKKINLIKLFSTIKDFPTKLLLKPVLKRYKDNNIKWLEEVSYVYR